MKPEATTSAAAADEPERTTPAAVILALIPVLALSVGIPFANRVEPRIFGLPFLPAYIAAWIVLTPLFMLGAYRSEQRG